MIRRLTLTIAGAAVLLLAVAAPALAGPAPAGAPKQFRAATTERFGWILQLRNTKATKYREDMTNKAFRGFALKGGRQQTWTDSTVPTATVEYKGLALSMLVGRIDDKDPMTFNKKLAAKGYNVVVEAVDGFKVTWTSQEITDRKDLIIADLANDAALALGSIKMKDDVASWKPNWPLKFVTGDPEVFGNRKPAAIQRITIEPQLPAQTAATTERFGWILQLRNTKATKYREDMTNKAFRGFALKGGRQQTWTDSTVPTATVEYKGLALSMLVGRIDDKDPMTFNKKLAAKGYNVVVEAVDGFKVTWTSQEITDRKDLIIADLANDAALALGSIKMKDDVASWKPNWPLKFVTGDPEVFGNRKPAAIQRITIEPQLPAQTGAAPFDQTRAAGKTGWTLTLQGKLKKVLPIGKVPATVAWHGEKAGNINPTLRYVYKGQTLYKLVGLVDDGDPSSFNVALARKGYKVQFFCRDGYKPKLPSKWIVGKKTWIVAKTKAGKLLTGEEAPFRLVGGPPITQPFNNKLSARGVTRIRLVF